jgi:hypothetical protein
MSAACPGVSDSATGFAECIDDGVDLCRQAAAGTADGLIVTVFFWAPALC